MCTVVATYHRKAITIVSTVDPSGRVNMDLGGGGGNDVIQSHVGSTQKTSRVAWIKSITEWESSLRFPELVQPAVGLITCETLPNYERSRSGVGGMKRVDHKRRRMPWRVRRSIPIRCTQSATMNHDETIRDTQLNNAELSYNVTVRVVRSVSVVVNIPYCLFTLTIVKTGKNAVEV